MGKVVASQRRREIGDTYVGVFDQAVKGESEMALVYEEEQRFMQAEEDKDRVLRDFDSLRNQYPDEYVGVVKGQVVYHDRDLDRLLATIRSEVRTTQGVFVLFIPSKYRTIAV